MLLVKHKIILIRIDVREQQLGTYNRHLMREKGFKLSKNDIVLD